MVDREDGDERLRHLLERCASWSREGRHRRILEALDGVEESAERSPLVCADLLLWKATALLAMSCDERALVVAERSWSLHPSPHAAFLTAAAQSGLGAEDEAESTLRLGLELFPEAVCVALQLATLLAQQGRVPEALEVLEDVDLAGADDGDEGLAAVSLHAAILTGLLRFDEARDVVRGASATLGPWAGNLEALASAIDGAEHRVEAAAELERSWSEGLERLPGRAGEVDDEISACGSNLDLPSLTVTAARRLWRGFLSAESTHPTASRAWATALLLAVGTIDGEATSVTVAARVVGASPRTVRTALCRLQLFLDGQEPALVRRAYGASSNPRLTDGDRGSTPVDGSVIAFPR